MILIVSVGRFVVGFLGGFFLQADLREGAVFGRGG